MKKILLVSESTVYTVGEQFYAHGGAAMYFHKLAVDFLKQGHEVEVFGIKEFVVQADEEVIDGVKYSRVAVASRMSFGVLWYLLKAWWRGLFFDTIVVNQFSPHLLLPFWFWKKKVAVVHDLYLKKGRRFWVENFGFWLWWLVWLGQALQIFFDQVFANYVLTVSEASRQKILACFVFGNPQKVLLNPYVVDVDKLERMKSASKEDFFIFVGRVVKYKNPLQALEVFRLFLEKHEEGERQKNLRMIFVITREYAGFNESLEDYFRRFPHLESRVTFVRSCSQADLYEYLGRARVLIQPSEVEGQGIVALEAVALGTFVVAYDLPAYRDFLVQRKNAFLARVGDVQGLVDGVAFFAGRELEDREGFLRKEANAQRFFEEVLRVVG